MARYQRKDAYHQRAKREGFRSRAAYKLQELQRAQRVLSRGDRVVDLGCWPGGWLQVASQRVGPKGRIVGVDLAEIQPPLRPEQVVALTADLGDPETATTIVEALGGQAALVLCDAAPKLTGVKATDRAREELLLESVEALIPLLLRPRGSLILKILEGPEAQAIVKRVQQSFSKAKTVKLQATRKGSTEKYLVARGFQGTG